MFGFFVFFLKLALRLYQFYNLFMQLREKNEDLVTIHCPTNSNTVQNISCKNKTAVLIKIVICIKINDARSNFR